MSNKEYQTSIFIFRRDLRLDDNTALINALKLSEEVIPIFILTPEQLDDKKNSYKSDHCVQYMIESLDELEQDLKSKKSRLIYFYDQPDKVIDQLLKDDKNEQIEAVFFNMDYTPYSKKRDQDIQKVCKEYEVDCQIYEDALLQPVKTILTGSKSVYQKFTPFFNAAKSKPVPKPQPNRYTNYISGSKKFKNEFNPNDLDKFYTHNEDIWINGGRSLALNILNSKSIKQFKTYNKDRNDLNKDTTYLSPANKFGTVSIREVYWAFRTHLGMSNDLIKQLYWRDFYYNLVWEFPHLITTKKNLKSQYDDIKWEGSNTNFKKWCEGKTGFPIIDAAMRSMNETGFMHNRARLIAASFLIKTLLVDWRKGEKYFAQTLYDYDPAVNNGNWAWVAGTGADSQPYFRIFNPWAQGERYDPDAEYIKEWLPELKDIPAKHLHQWDKFHSNYTKEETNNYPSPIVDYKESRQKALDMYKKALK